LKLRRITISLNETTAPKHRAMSRGPERLFQQAVDGIAAIVAAKREARADAEISVQAFIWKENFRRIEEMTAFLADTGADLIYLSAIDLLPAELRMTPEERDELRSLFPGLMRKWADRIRTNFDAEGLTESVREEQAKVCPSAVTLPDLCPTAERIEFCNMPWYAPVIDATGNVFPCCHLTTDPSKSLGDLHAESLKDIWQGRKARALRAEMRHLLLTHANRRLLPRRPRFIVSLCLERAACAFNFYLCSPRFYTRIHEWAESGPRRRYTARRRLLAGARGVLRTAKRTAKRLLKAG
jgi:MoaA/NifB/PqqE/SkfB family radical SAM enzyme